MPTMRPCGAKRATCAIANPGPKPISSHVISRLDVQQVDRPAIAFDIGRPIRHDPARKPSEESSRPPELTIHRRDKAHGWRSPLRRSEAHVRTL